MGRHVAEVPPGAAAADHRAGPLSARELEVARLIAGGATNRQIAAGLQIAPRTASAHVEHILRKLGASRRTEIAVWVATRHGAGSPVTGVDSARARSSDR